MNAVFCSNCGAKHQYSFAKPNFCSKCGSTMGASIASESKVKEARVQSRAKPEDYEYDDEEYSDVDYAPNLRKIDVDVEQFSDNSSFTLGSLFGDTSSPSQPRRKSFELDDFVSQKPRRG